MYHTCVGCVYHTCVGCVYHTCVGFVYHNCSSCSKPTHSPSMHHPLRPTCPDCSTYFNILKGLSSVSPGETPERRQFCFPRHLTKSRQHSELLSQFREQYVPVPDLFPVHLALTVGDAAVRPPDPTSLCQKVIPELSNGHAPLHQVCLFLGGCIALTTCVLLRVVVVCANALHLGGWCVTHTPVFSHVFTSHLYIIVGMGVLCVH